MAGGARAGAGRSLDASDSGEPGGNEAALRQQVAQLEEQLANLSVVPASSTRRDPPSDPIDCSVPAEVQRITKLARIERFTGDRNRAKAFCAEISRLLSAHNQMGTWAGFVFATGHLVDDARVWYELQMETAAVQSWAALQPLLLAEFQSRTAARDARLSLRELTQTGTVLVYNTHFRRLVALVPTMTDEEKQFLYRKGLCDELQYLLCKDTFASCQEMMAMTADVASRLPPERTQPAQPIFAVMPVGGAAGKIAGRCFACNKVGHFKRNCPNMRTGGGRQFPSVSQPGRAGTGAGYTRPSGNPFSGTGAGYARPKSAPYARQQSWQRPAGRQPGVHAMEAAEIDDPDSEFREMLDSTESGNARA